MRHLYMSLARSFSGKRTIAKSLSFLGAAINQGQPLEGVAKGPMLIR